MSEIPKNDDEASDGGLRTTALFGSSDTPETESVNAQGVGYAVRFYAMKTHARKLERERNELRSKYAMHHAEAEIITSDNIRLKCTLAKWYEWARMHGHLGHAEGITADTRDALQSLPNVKEHAPSPAGASVETGGEG